MLTFFQKIPRKTIVEILILTVLLCWYGLFLFHKIDLTTADLGRHLKNGELILENFSFENQVLKTNFYSYTQSEYPTLNHHWLAGVVFFAVFKAVGFYGVHLFFIILSFLAFWLFFRIAKKEAGIGLAAVLSLLIIPLISERTEIRPEVFSYVFAGLFLNLLWDWREGRVGWKKLLFLPLIEVFWVNLHIYFFLGPIIVFVFLIEKITHLFHGREKCVTGGLLTILFLSILAVLINPFGIEGTLAPLNIFNNYGYRLVENQSIWFLGKLGFIINLNFLLFKIVFLALAISLVVAMKISKKNFPLVNLFLVIGFSLAGFFAIRNFTISGLFSLPLIAANIKIIAEKIPLPEKINLDFFSVSFNSLLIISGTLVLIFGLMSHSQKLSFSGLGLGATKGNDEAIEFFKKENLRGPIFNNYDIGGYLIFYLFPQERVFVDNRPEAYSRKFFEKEYIPMQEDGQKWKQVEDQYGFNAIFFAWHDATPWGQQFLIERIKDNDWVPVFADQFAIIFLKRNEKNQQIIERYELPKDYFKVI